MFFQEFNHQFVNMRSAWPVQICKRLKIHDHFLEERTIHFLLRHALTWRRQSQLLFVTRSLFVQSVSMLEVRPRIRLPLTKRNSRLQVFVLRARQRIQSAFPGRSSTKRKLLRVSFQHWSACRCLTELLIQCFIALLACQHTDTIHWDEQDMHFSKIVQNQYNVSSKYSLLRHSTAGNNGCCCVMLCNA